MTWDAMGPGVGIQTTGGPHPGRLIIPARRRNIYSDDHGQTWHYQIIPAGTDEGTIVELADGTLMRNDRPGERPGRRPKGAIFLPERSKEVFQHLLPLPHCPIRDVKAQYSDMPATVPVFFS